MECFCDCIPHIHVFKSFCLTAVFISDNFVGFGIAVLIAISILHLLLTKDKIIKIQIKGQETAQVGDTVCLTGNVEFHPSVKYLKWQKYHNGYFVDININKSKYQGSTKNLQNPRLVINDVDQDDEADYRLEVQLAKSSQHSNIRNVEILSSTALETPTIRIYPDEPDGRYYVGEDVTIKASIRNPLGVLCVTWQKETEAGTHTINTALSKYKETSNATDEHHLLIRDCNDSDQGGYFLLAACNYDQEDARSNKIYLNIVKGPPIVTLSQVSETVYEKPVEFKAAIRIFPKQCDVNWLRGSQQIDINQPKYAGSTVVGASPVLWINEVNKDDEGDYSIEVINKEWEPIRISKKLVVNTEKPTVFLKISEESDSMNFGNTITLKAEITASPTPSSIQWIRINKKGKNEEIKNKSGKFLIKNSNENCQTLRIENLDFSDNGKYQITVTNAVGEAQNALDIKVGGQMIFIAGPTVVAPAGIIKFRTEYHISESFSNPMWLKIKNFLAKEIVFDGAKYSVYNTASASTIKNQKFVIADAEKEGDTAAYQLSLSNRKSNKLNIFVDNCGEYSTEQEGNCLRFFALQTVSTNAMRIAFDMMMPAKCEEKIKEFKRYCKKHPKNKRIQEQLSIKYFVLIRNFLIRSNIIVKNITVNVSREIFDYTLILYFVLRSIYNAIFYLI